MKINEVLGGKDMIIDKDELILADAFIVDNIDRLYRWSVGDVRRAARLNNEGVFEEDGALVGAFLLWCAAIDYWGGLLTNHQSSSKDRIVGFITSYLVKYGDYRSLEIYDLRNKLLHNYQPSNFALIHVPESEPGHLLMSKYGRLLHLKKCIEHLEGGVNNYITELKTVDDLKIKAWRYFKKFPPIRMVNSR